ncbi:MAG: DinB family protein [Cyclobacteriaceae bacterium]|nr:DinB family protein [Cyclobacteriaceae bacterium]
MFLNLETVPSFYKNYVKLITEPDVLIALRVSGYRTLELIHSIPPAKADYRYADGKWTIRELLCHMQDAERIFAYRALRFARNDKTVLSSFDENSYAPEANASSRSLKKIADEMQHLRTSTLDLFEAFTEEMLARKGHINTNELSVSALGFIIAGHETHHRRILQERYLNQAPH